MRDQGSKHILNTQAAQYLKDTWGKMRRKGSNKYRLPNKGKIKYSS
jgi:hypothetical protein